MDNVSNVTSARSVGVSSLEGDTEANHKTVGLGTSNTFATPTRSTKFARYDIRGKKYLSSGDKYYLVATTPSG